MTHSPPEPISSPPASSTAAAPELAIKHRTTPALVLSLALHVVLLTSLGLILSSRPRGTDAPPDRAIGIALVHRLPDRDRYVDAAEMTPTESPRTEDSSAETASSTSAAPPADLMPPIDLDGVLKSLQSTPAPLSASGIAGDTRIDGDAFEGHRGAGEPTESNQTTTTVFGVSGSGSRFVYVFDRSDSMNGHGGKPLRAAKRELIRSLSSLTDRQRFQIVFYNDKPTPFRMAGVPLQLVAGESSHITRAQRYVESIAAFGGTRHAAALKLALQMGPDVIFFLTDARIPRLSGSELLEIQQRADRSGTSIHAIEFGTDPAAPGDSFLRELAAMNQGQYQYVDVRRLDATSTNRPAGAASDADPARNAEPANEVSR